jgi:dihydroneopterin aldolase
MDTLSITNLALWTHIGVTDEERSKEQRVLVTITMEGDTRAAAKADDEKKSIDYEKVVDVVHALASTERKTIERLAEDVADTIEKKWKPKSVTVNVQKMIVPGTDSVSVNISRSTP